MAGRLSLLCQDVIQSLEAPEANDNASATSPGADSAQDLNSARSRYNAQRTAAAALAGAASKTGPGARAWLNTAAGATAVATAAAISPGIPSPGSPRVESNTAEATSVPTTPPAPAVLVKVPGLKLTAAHSSTTFGKGGPGRPQKQPQKASHGEITNRSAEHPVGSLQQGAAAGGTAASGAAAIAAVHRQAQGVTAPGSAASAAAAARASCISDVQRSRSCSPIPRGNSPLPPLPTTAAGTGSGMRVAGGSDGGAGAAPRALNASPMARTSCLRPSEAVTAKVGNVRPARQQQRDASVSAKSFGKHGTASADGLGAAGGVKKGCNEKKGKVSQHQWSVRSCLAAAGQGWLQQKVEAQEKPGSKGREGLMTVGWPVLIHQEGLHVAVNSRLQHWPLAEQANDHRSLHRASIVAF
jgi:hypothetical protein